MRFEVASLLKLDITEKEQKKIWENVLKDMTSDDLWDMNSPMEAALSKQGLLRYSWEKSLGTTVATGSSSPEGVFGTKESGQKTKDIFLEDGGHIKEEPERELGCSLLYEQSLEGIIIGVLESPLRTASIRGNISPDERRGPFKGPLGVSFWA